MRIQSASVKLESALGLHLCGHGRERQALRQADELEVQCLALTTATAKVLMVSVDTLFVGDEITQALHAMPLTHGFTIIPLASHTHSAPAATAVYPRLGTSNAAWIQATTEAVKSCVSQALAQTTNRSDMATSRIPLNLAIGRRKRFFGVGKAHWMPSGIQRADDATVWTFRDATGVRAVLWTYACHPTAFPDDLAISADFIGVVRSAIRAKFGNIPVLFAQGCSGDIRPPFCRARQIAFGSKVLQNSIIDPVLAAVGIQEFRQPHLNEWIEWADAMASKVVGAAEIATRCETHRLEVSTRTLRLGELANLDNPSHDRHLKSANVSLGPNSPALVACEAELLSVWERQITEQLSLHPHSIITGCCWRPFGYLPHPRQIRESGYEVDGFWHGFGLSGTFRRDYESKVLAWVTRPTCDHISFETDAS